MFCEKCGNQIAGGSLFCEKCGAKLDYPTVQTTPQAVQSDYGSAQRWSVGEKTFAFNSQSGINIAGKNIRPKTILAAVAGLIALFVLVLALMSSGRNYLYKAIARSEKAYSKEIEAFVNKNPVLNAIKSNLNKSYTQEYDIFGSIIKISDDKSKKVLAVSADVRSMPVGAEVYITDKQIIAGVSGVAYLAADPKELSDNLNSFAARSDLGRYEDSVQSLADSFAGVDLSYSAITGNEIENLDPNMKRITKRYLNLLKKLVDKSDYMTSGGNLNIGGKNIKTKKIAITIEPEVLCDWLEEDIILTMRADKDLEKYFPAIRQITYSTDDTMDEFIDGFEEEIAYFNEYMDDNDVTLIVTFDVYKGVIVCADVLFAEKYSNNSVNLSFTGDKYRLNEINFAVRSDKQKVFTFTAVGDHIGADTVTSDIRIKDNYGNSKVSIDWDTKSVSDNLRLNLAGTPVTATFAAQDKGVIAKFELLGQHASWRIMPISQTVKIPDKTYDIAKISLGDIVKDFGGMVNGFF